MTQPANISDLFPIGSDFDGEIVGGLQVKGAITGHGEFHLVLAKDDGFPAYVSWDALRAAVHAGTARFRFAAPALSQRPDPETED